MVILTTLVGIVLSLLVEFFVYVGSMRTSIYTTLSSGFQLGKIWAMIRYDLTGLLRILAMSIVVGLVVSVIIGIIAVVLVLLGVFAATLVHGSEAIHSCYVPGYFFCWYPVVLFSSFFGCFKKRSWLVLLGIGCDNLRFLLGEDKKISCLLKSNTVFLRFSTISLIRTFHFNRGEVSE